jgi:hypothetical protein
VLRQRCLISDASLLTPVRGTRRRQQARLSSGCPRSQLK